MKKQKRGNRKLKKQFTNRKKEKIRKIYIQEFLRGYRSDLIIEKISDQFLIAPSTLYEYIRPATLTKEIKAGNYPLDENYQSMFNQKI